MRERDHDNVEDRSKNFSFVSAGRKRKEEEREIVVAAGKTEKRWGLLVNPLDAENRRCQQRCVHASVCLSWCIGRSACWAPTTEQTMRRRLSAFGAYIHTYRHTYEDNNNNSEKPKKEGKKEIKSTINGLSLSPMQCYFSPPHHPLSLAECSLSHPLCDTFRLLRQRTPTSDESCCCCNKYKVQFYSFKSLMRGREYWIRNHQLHRPISNC